MNAWLIAALALLGGLAVCGLACTRGGAADRLVGLQLAGTVTTLTLLVLAVGYGRSVYADLAVVLAVLSFAGVMVFVRFLERWL